MDGEAQMQESCLVASFCGVGSPAKSDVGNGGGHLVGRDVGESLVAVSEDDGVALGVGHEGGDDGRDVHLVRVVDNDQLLAAGGSEIIVVNEIRGTNGNGGLVLANFSIGASSVANLCPPLWNSSDVLAADGAAGEVRIVVVCGGRGRRRRTRGRRRGGRRARGLGVSARGLRLLSLTVVAGVIVVVVVAATATRSRVGALANKVPRHLELTETKVSVGERGEESSAHVEIAAVRAAWACVNDGGALSVAVVVNFDLSTAILALGTSEAVHVGVERNDVLVAAVGPTAGAQTDSIVRCTAAGSTSDGSGGNVDCSSGGHDGEEDSLCGEHAWL